MAGALAGRTIALAEGRQLEELAQMLEKEDATALRCPMLSILDAPDAAPIVAWLRDLIAGRFSHVILMTGEGLRRLIGFAEREDIRAPFISALGQRRIITRGPKPVRALKEIGLLPTKVAESPTTEGVIAVLRQEILKGQTIGFQSYSDANPSLVQFLEEAGAQVRVVLPYVYAPAADSDRLAQLIANLAAGQVNVLVFTSSPQIDRLFALATERGLLDSLQQGLARTRVAAVGPVVAESIIRRGARVDICPQQGFVMKNLVAQIIRDVGSTASRQLGPNAGA